MTDDELHAIEDRANKATPGPWEQDVMYVTAEVPTGRPGGEVIVQCRETAGRFLSVSHVDNAAFIANARTDVPALIAEIRRLREVERIANDTLSRIASCGCTQCPPKPRDLVEASGMADHALTCMSVVD